MRVFFGCAMNVIAVIIARGGSKGVPGKNIKNIGECSLVAHSIRSASRASELVGFDVLLSTDSEEIRQIAVRSPTIALTRGVGHCS